MLPADALADTLMAKKIARSAGLFSLQGTIYNLQYSTFTLGDVGA